MGFITRLFQKKESIAPVIPIRPQPSVINNDIVHMGGIDVSHYDGDINWDHVKSAGIKFVICKATEGISHVDPYFKKNYEGAKNAGLIAGAYHFFRPECSAKVQASVFLQEYKYTPGDIVPVLDWEVNDGVSPEDMRQGALEFLSIVKDASEVIPMIYGSPGFLSDAVGGVAYFTQHPLWIAHYGVDKPTIPRPWDKAMIWQTTESGYIPGINGKCDINVITTTKEEFKKIVP